MEACVSAVPTYEEVVRLMKVEYTEKVTGNRYISIYLLVNNVFFVCFINIELSAYFLLYCHVLNGGQFDILERGGVSWRI